MSLSISPPFTKTPSLFNSLPLFLCPSCTSGFYHGCCCSCLPSISPTGQPPFFVLFFSPTLSEPPLTANLSGLLNVSLSVCFSTRSVISSKTTSQALIFLSQAYFFEFSLVFLHPFLHISIVLSLPVIGVEDKLPYGRERQEVWLKNDRPQFRTVSTFCRTNMRIQMHTKQTVLPWKSTQFYRWLNHVRL